MRKSNLFLVFNLTLLIVLGMFFTLLYNTSFYESLFIKTNAENLTFSMDVSGEVLDYFKDSNKGPPTIDVFTDDENSHMRDVKILLKGISFLFSALIIVLIIQFYFQSRSKDRNEIRNNIEKILLNSGLLLLFVPILFIVIPFDFLFTWFHYILFPQGNWQFPQSSVMIYVFPWDFFLNFAIAIFIRLFIVGVLFITFSIILKKSNILKK